MVAVGKAGNSVTDFFGELDDEGLNLTLYRCCEGLDSSVGGCGKNFFCT
jgi:hypothetical protein